MSTTGGKTDGLGWQDPRTSQTCLYVFGSLGVALAWDPYVADLGAVVLGAAFFGWANCPLGPPLRTSKLLFTPSAHSVQHLFATQMVRMSIKHPAKHPTNHPSTKCPRCMRGSVRASFEACAVEPLLCLTECMRI